MREQKETQFFIVAFCFEAFFFEIKHFQKKRLAPKTAQPKTPWMIKNIRIPRTQLTSIFEG